MTKEQYYTKYGITDSFIKADLEAVIATEIAKVQEAQTEEQKGNCSTFDMSRLVDQEQPALNPIEQAYHNGVKIREVNLHKPKWIKKHTTTQAVDDTGHYWDFIEDLDFTTHPENWELYTEPADQPEMTEKEKIDHILTNKLTWKPMGNKRFYANMFSGKASDGSRQVCFVDYNNPHSGYFETRIFKIDLAEWQPVETEQPSSQAKLDNSFDKDRFEAMFRAVVASGDISSTEIFASTEYLLAQLDAYYASKEGGVNE